MSFEDDATALSNLWLWAYSYGYGCIDATYKDTLNYYMDTTYRNEWGKLFRTSTSTL